MTVLDYGYDTSSIQHLLMCNINVSVEFKHSKLKLSYFQFVFHFIRLLLQLF